jgi:uncharacterized protein (DUF1800 family)
LLPFWIYSRYSMKKTFRSLCLLVFVLTSSSVLLSFGFHAGNEYPPYRFPYKNEGLSDREAAAHLLSRFSFGATPGQVDGVVKMGAEKWFATQLEGSLNDDRLDAMLSGYPSLKMSTEQIVQTYPKPGQLLRKAIKDGDVEMDSLKKGNKKDYRDEVKEYMRENNLRPQQELFRELINQKILRAAYSNNQLEEVLTDFWFNHFNVSLTKGDLRQFVTGYERDAIRPHVLGKFEDLLLATAKSPAMLAYLDNFKSTVNEEDETMGQKMAAKKREEVMDSIMDSTVNKNAKGKIKKPKMQGLNENYAREIMELHTLGVDGGYTQSDVTQAARVLTGWTVNPEIEYNVKAKRNINQQRLQKLGFVIDGDFLFAANKHDKGEKKVLGTIFPAGGGYEEGVRLIHMLATHPSTAKFISRKLAVHFVSDNPPQSLIDKMSKTFLEKNGDIKEVLITMVTAPEFWNKAAVREKTKSPFELAISAVRSMNAQVIAPFQLSNWITRMGQKIYYYQAPTGFPDRGQYWINTGSLLNRMNFGLAIASQRIPGVKIDLLALNQNHEPESAEQALKTYSRLLMPERNVDETVKRLTPLLTDPDLAKKLDDAAATTATAKEAMKEEDMMNEPADKKPAKKQGGKKNNIDAVQLSSGNNSMLAQVVGIIIGSPEFQRK